MSIDAQSHTPSDLDREAEAWLVQLTSRTGNPADSAAARAWCGQSPEHRAAFQRARRFWRHAGATIDTSTLDTPRTDKRAFAMAAAVLLAVTIGFAGTQLNWTADYRTSTGEQQRITLADGSTVLLDAGTAIDVHYSAARRDIHLREGQALFEVAHDAARPFVVHDDSVTATALGTVYAVRHTKMGPQVTVQQGRVAVAGEDGSAVTLVAGEQASYSASGVSQDTVDSNQATAWARQLIFCKSTPLADIVAELNRHRPGLIVMADRDLDNILVSGVFRLDQPDETLANLAAIFPIERFALTDYVVVLRKKR